MFQTRCTLRLSLQASIQNTKAFWRNCISKLPRLPFVSIHLLTRIWHFVDIAVNSERIWRKSIVNMSGSSWNLDPTQKLNYLLRQQIQLSIERHRNQSHVAITECSQNCVRAKLFFKKTSRVILNLTLSLYKPLPGFRCHDFLNKRNGIEMAQISDFKVWTLSVPMVASPKRLRENREP